MQCLETSEIPLQLHLGLDSHLKVLLPVALMRFLILLTAALWLGGLTTGGLWKVTVGTFCVSFWGPTFQLILEPAFSTVYHGLSIFVRRAAP